MHLSRLSIHVSRNRGFPISCFPRRSVVSEREIEVTIGETIQVGNLMVTVVDVENGEIRFHVEDGGSELEFTEEFQTDL
ncbi:hypothetical protein Mal4_17680 [Maioricimonas rarisocia]|uniref:Uncharacterized protein n=1 Tax=Maioricimonas rarisocia TaxID=2528026 RepID=A0A517Z4S8_9PLAN|nr:hypothetical protein Mal4_17680 [Maioricimonas rarisocia]